MQPRTSEDCIRGHVCRYERSAHFFFTPPCRFFVCGRILMIFFLSTPHHVYSPKHIAFFFYDHYDVRYGHFSTSGVSKNHIFSSFWLTAFLLDFCPTFFWSKIDA